MSPFFTLAINFNWKLSIASDWKVSAKPLLKEIEGHV